MLKLYGYLGLALIIFAEINFLLVIQPFASWYIPIVWYGYILFIDSLVYKVKKKSLISSYPKEFLLMLVVSVPFWLIFELYNIFTFSWIYINYTWTVHLLDFTTIMPAVLETFSLMNVLEIGKRFDNVKINKLNQSNTRDKALQRNFVKALLALGAIVAVMPFILPRLQFQLIWIGLFLLLVPLNYLIGRPSVIEKISRGNTSILIRLFLSGIIAGFFWEFWNYQAYPKWIYSFPVPIGTIHIFEMPLFGYLGYLPFALEVFLFYALFRSFIFKKGNELLSI